jgi:hypothetical protein
VHGVAAPEKHGVRHSRAVEMRARRAPILARIDIRYDDITKVVHVIAESGRDMVFVFPDHAILAGWCGKPGFARGNGRFADKRFALEEIGALFPDMDNDPCIAGNAIAVPSIRHRSRSGCRPDRFGRLHFRAAGEDDHRGKSDCTSKQRKAGHKDAHSNAFASLFNAKH